MRIGQKIVGLFLGPFLFVIILSDVIALEGLDEEGRAVLGCAVWLASWWITEALPISATALLPIVLLPASNGASIEQTTAAYGDKMLFLFVGGFIIAVAMQKWNLHRRIALHVINRVGTRPDRLMLGFMLATGFLSMWISNTATTLMMMTIALALIRQLEAAQENTQTAIFFKALLLSIAFSASIGGVATLVGTPTNPIFAALVSDLYDVDFSFFGWMQFALPFSLLMLLVTWQLLSRVVFDFREQSLPISAKWIEAELNGLGRWSREEKWVALVFLLTAAAWISRSFLLQWWMPRLNDTMIAITGALCLFIIPSRKGRILNWTEAEGLPWGVIILFGGGLSLAAAFRSSGLAEWLGEQLAITGSLPVLLAVIIITLSINFLTEITSNVATASMFLPVLAALAEVIGVHPYMLMIPATMAASCAFMLPVATAPNAIVFGSGHLEIKDMVRAGIWLNILSSLLIACLVYFFSPAF